MTDQPKPVAGQTWRTDCVECVVQSVGVDGVAFGFRVYSFDGEWGEHGCTHRQWNRWQSTARLVSGPGSEVSDA